MRERLEEWAVYFAAFGIALWVAAGLLKVLGQIQDVPLIALVVLGLVFIGLYVYTRPSEVRAAVTSRGVRYGSNTLVMIVAFVGIVGLLNFLGSRYSYRWDLTASKSYTLADQTIAVLKSLKEPVKATAFFSPRNPPGQADEQSARDELKLYAEQTDKFTYQFIDPDAQPAIATEYNLTSYGTIVFERGTRRENAFGIDESSLTNALLKVSQDKQPTVYFTTGHGEHSPEDTSGNGYNIVQSGMQNLNFKVATLDLRTITDTMPADMSALIVAGPTQPFQPQETKQIGDYLDKGGSVLIMVDPHVDTGLDSLLAAWGLKLDNDEVIDPKNGLFGNQQEPIVQSFNTHDITKNLTDLNPFFPGVRSIETITSTVSGRTPTALFSSSDSSWGETNFDSIKNQNEQFDQGSDLKGPLTLAYVVQGTGDKAGRLVVIGNSTFITDNTFNARYTTSGGQQAQVRSGNGQLFVNTLNWLAAQENLISIPPKATSSSSSPLFLTGEQSLFVYVSTTLLLPVTLLLIGTLVWWRRR
ncbi:MAG: GldG family protein [Chloroflexi bacterium]|nr:GldG family protein [Chloroflexota bacterium]